MRPETSPSQDGPPRFPIAGVGASAGGLESLEKLFRALPSHPGVAFVVVQHLSPDFKSLMDELLSRFTDLSIHGASEGVEVAPDHVYLLPPGKEIEIREGRLRLFDRDPRAGLTLPIDRFLASLAADAAERSVAIILSGSGTDGSRGARRVHEAGGLVVVEDPDAARFDGMPRAAIDAGVADVVLPAEAIAGALADRIADGESIAPSADADLIPRVVALLRGAFGIDFGQYKLPTVLRRIRRRISLKQHPDLEAYLDTLQTNPEELAALGNDLLIGVTCFYRDPATWEALDSRVFPQLAAEATAERGLRAWVSGCATGEEAYSVAMSLIDAAQAHPGVQVKVFATDVHKRALEVASQGIYDAEHLANVDERRRQRYFVKRSDGRLQVSQELRHAVVFAQHNVLKDAPFTQLDFVSCRNLLIYFKPAAQRQALALLQYGLRIGGNLVLGPSENLGESASEYEAVDESHRIFVKVRHSRRLPELSMTKQVAALLPRGRSAGDQLLGLYDAVLDRVMPPSFLLDSDRGIIDSFGGAERLLRVRPRRPSADLLDLAPEVARLSLAGAIARASRERAAVRFDGIEWAHDGESARVDIVVDPIDGPSRPRAFLVTLRPAGSAATTAAVAGSGPGTALAAKPMDAGELSAERFCALEQELKQCKESLQATIEELESSSEEMQATNEELVASNEELQSTNEELHSVNEELHTVNAELQSKIRELSDLNRDMRRLFESIDSAIVFLDGALRIRRFTPRAAAMFGLLDHDAGRPLASFQHPLRRPSLMEDIAACRDARKPFEQEVADVHGRTHLVRLNAYGGPDGTDGVVLSVTDLTALAAARERVELLSSIVATSADAIIGLDRERRVTAWNAAAERMYGWTESEAVGSAFDRLVPADMQPELSAALGKAWTGEVQSLETVRLHRDGTRIDISTTLSPVCDSEGRVLSVSKIDRDIRERKRREAAMAARERRLADLYDDSPDMFVSVDLATGRLVEFNRTLSRCLGYSRDELLAMHSSRLYTPECREAAYDLEESLKRTGEIRDAEITMRRKDGTPVDVSVNATGVREASGEVTRSRCVVRDVTARKQAQRTLAEAAAMRERFLAVVSHELRTPLYAVRTAAAILAAPGSGDSNRSRALDVLGRQTTQMTRLLDDLLDVSRITQSRFHLVREPMDLRDPVRAAVDACTAAYPQSGVTIALRLADEPMRLRGDAARLQQVVGNLLGNALRHSPPGSTVEVGIVRAGDRARVVVEDAGEGIDPSRLATIFDMFSTGGGAGRTGLGLGLSLARRIVEGHGGSVRAESDGAGRGARFTVEVPLDDAAVAPAESPAGSARLRIVLVEDHPDALEMIGLLLEMRGHEVSRAASGTEGIRKILTERPDVALVDIGLPDVDGYGVARAVRADAGDAVPLVALTGYGQPDDVKRSHDAGFTRHLTKPPDHDALERVVQDLALSRKR